ncbi:MULTISPECIES: sugar phosphate isomerase/epimerase family protein [unclassified Brenneria]|uniref:sugar phosphate isomerase/epimerase family protein n=1 Tax=unclassified Brenneria TaxID=2634434 RepID=UPI001557F67A|nr:sugar phosphate isomerase/epimerase family protein [Brenneria sp. hezel4-2-4]MEE3650354.1 sugar phosphate isomerase/epimerase family protein [Brenneria sp. HEZEL_4_2_4]NPD00310.1 sugar phosphate isomerase/epimerase [Brenneria sp. hezel4-2-4]
MKKALHGVSVWYSNAVTQLRIAKDSGFDALEILPEHLFRYLDNGGSFENFTQLMESYGIEISCINALKRIGRYQPAEHEALIQEARKICHAAQMLRCPVVQIMALNELDDLSEETRNEILVKNISEIADIAKSYGIKLQIEVVAFTRFNSLSQALEIIKRVGRDNVGLVIDFWHLHAGGATTPDEVARMDVNLIYGVHFCDGRAARPGEVWDEWVQRDYQPGEGDVDIPAWINAVRATGYDGVWCPEQLSPTHWEDDLWQIAKDNYHSLTAYTA